MHASRLLDRYVDLALSQPKSAIDLIILSTVNLTVALEDIWTNQDRDPTPFLDGCLERQIVFLGDASTLCAHLATSDTPRSNGVDVGQLFEAAWTTYTPATYDHSISLIEDRFLRNGLDREFFSGKRCFDGGTGTGRLSIALSRLGAAEIVSADIGTASLAFLRGQADRLEARNIKTVECDVTSLSGFETGSFDFVASYGVLHHTPDPIGGLKEHFRILKPGGKLWLYLYGAGGMYWATYDRLREIVSRFSVAEVKRSLQKLGLREGLIYTYLDNVLAPRTYHTEREVIAALRPLDPGFKYERARGGSVIDSVDKSLTSRFGEQIAGPQGEVRLIITKSGRASLGA